MEQKTRSRNRVREISDLKSSLVALRESRYGVNDRSLSEHEYLSELLSRRNAERPFVEFKAFATDRFTDLRLRPAILGLALSSVTENKLRNERLILSQKHMNCSVRTFQRQEAESCEELAYDIFHYYNAHSEEEINDEYTERSDTASIGDLYRKLDVLIAMQNDITRDLIDARSVSSLVKKVNKDVTYLKEQVEEMGDLHLDLDKKVTDILEKLP